MSMLTSLWIKTLKEGTTLVMLAKLLLWMSMLTLFESIYTLKEGTTLVMLAKLLLWMSMLTLFESRYTLKERYNIGNVGKTASMSMLTLFESRYTLKEGTTLVMLAKLLLWVCLLSLSQYTLKERYNIGNVGQTASSSSSMTQYAYSLWIKIYIEGKVQHWQCWINCFYEYAYSLWIKSSSLMRIIQHKWHEKFVQIEISRCSEKCRENALFLDMFQQKLFLQEAVNLFYIVPAFFQFSQRRQGKKKGKNSVPTLFTAYRLERSLACLGQGPIESALFALY